MLEALSGATRLFVILGDPIAQVQSPGSLTRAFVARGHNAVLVPMQVAAAELDEVMRGLSRVGNLDGIVATVPHKFAAFAHCRTTTPRAGFLRSVNVLRRNSDGSWHGDMTDGAAFIDGLRQAGFAPEGKRALLVGAGGAGTAMALALVEAGVAALAIHDADAARRDLLLARLEGRGAVLAAGSDDPAGQDLVANATPAGMRPGDALPVRVNRLSPDSFVADVVTSPEVTPLLAAARALGCGTQTGLGMYAAGREMMVDFLLQEPG
ncbi:shikimate dehydrogenase family protein [Falsiroseomonas tokyonensis]|uniref:Shikimate dehydrogenase family protein n=1 Tax=Falsiroseomonas tokyonensis TaxID=430521 RepID=A0ABV7BMJ2_9PROT|nr:shikimate dehydrogenase [Falsiroseomonas tokyonensis]MBU8536775.1 shikimate dehydrogenase [Falsiroseomonas tokyonensis]